MVWAEGRSSPPLSRLPPAPPLPQTPLFSRVSLKVGKGKPGSSLGQAPPPAPVVKRGGGHGGEGPGWWGWFQGFGPLLLGTPQPRRQNRVSRWEAVSKAGRAPPDQVEVGGEAQNPGINTGSLAGAVWVHGRGFNETSSLQGGRQSRGESVLGISVWKQHRCSEQRSGRVRDPRNSRTRSS